MENLNSQLSQTEINKIVKLVVSHFSDLKGAKFVGIKEYRAKSSNELANHVVNANFNYGNAVQKDLNSLETLKATDLESISESTSIPSTVILDAVNALKTAFINNQNKETASNQSTAQTDLYLPITNSIKLNLTTGKLHIYALAISKTVLEAGTYKIVNSRQLTIAKNAVKKYCNFSTAKYRNFIIDEKYLSSVNISGENITVK